MESSVRYIVDDTAMAIAFYELLGFEVVAHPGPGFAMLRRDGLRLLLNTPGGGGGAGRDAADGTTPAPGGWNRFQLPVDDIDAEVHRLSGQRRPLPQRRRRRPGRPPGLGRRSLGQPRGALPGARDHGLISVGFSAPSLCESRTEWHPGAFRQPVMQYSALVKLIRRALAALGLAAAIASALRLRGRGGTPPQHGGWQPIDLDQR